MRRIPFLQFGMLAVLAAAASWFGVGCLSPTSDRSCSDDDPCFQGERCFEGTCYQLSNLPTRATDGGPDDGGKDTDGGSSQRCKPFQGSGPVLGEKDFCSTLDSVRSLDACGLKEEWAKSPEADDQSSGKDPGSSCNTDKPSSCVGYCRHVNRTNPMDSGLECIHLMFTSSEKFDGSFDTSPTKAPYPTQNADCACQLLALKAGLEGTYQAILSTKTRSAAQRAAIRTDVYQVYTPNRGQFSDDKLTWEIKKDNTLDGHGFWRINHKEKHLFNERGNNITKNASTQIEVWTGWGGDESQRNGDQNCKGWSATSDAEKQGITGLANGNIGNNWVESSSSACTEKQRIYCIQQ